jgi:hypothetical protein
MSASLRTKDGSVSIAGVILANEKAASRQAPIDMDGAIAWERENGVDLRRVKRPLTRTPTIRTTRPIHSMWRPPDTSGMGRTSPIGQMAEQG